MNFFFQDLTLSDAHVLEIVFSNCCFSNPRSPSTVYIHIRVIVHDSDNHTVKE
jgi:hypothetical protein